MTESLLPHQMPGALEYAPDTIKVLSLDCFDTLLWRDCYAPTDLFAALPDVSTGQRVVAETRARKAQGTLKRRTEVGIDAIYDQALPNADKSMRAAAVEAELKAEAATCFAFEPTVELMRRAKQRGHKVVIVSDTYLTASALQQLICDAAGQEIADLIDKVFASSEAGVSKSQGMLAKVLKQLKCKPHEVLHIGDNKSADLDGARALGIPALHLVQFSEAARQRFRLERTCHQLIGDARNHVRGLMPHRALLARDEPQVEDPAIALGFSVLGPIFQAYDQWLRGEEAALKKERGGTVHWLFMLRDGHLPHCVHQEGGEAQAVARVEISRFTAIAASLSSRAEYQKQFALEYGLNPSTLARQMLFEESEIAAIVGDPLSDAEKVEASERLRTELRKGTREKQTIRKARGRAERLIAHIRKTVDPQPGDTLMLVDLGYNGSAQDRVDKILAEAFDVHVAGRYLLLRETAATGLDKKGLIDPRHYDAELLEAMCANVAVLEQLATCELGSVADYTDDGDPIRKAPSVKGAQSDVRDRVQAGTAQFARSAASMPIIRQANAHQSRAWRETAAAALTRFMFLPQSRELEVLKSFEHDVNLGSERVVPLFDADHAQKGMRRRGLFYMKGSARMFLPAELAQEDMNTRLSLLAQTRFGLGLSYADSTGRTLSIPVIYLGQNDTARSTIEAHTTHDGFFAARIPVVAGAKAVAIQLGSLLEWFELGEITSASLASLKGDLENDQQPQELAVQLDGFTTHAPGLLEATDPAAFALVNAPSDADTHGTQMIEISLRPIRYRKQLPAGSNLSAPISKEAAA